MTSWGHWNHMPALLTTLIPRNQPGWVHPISRYARWCGARVSTLTHVIAANTIGEMPDDLKVPQ